VRHHQQRTPGELADALDGLEDGQAGDAEAEPELVGQLVGVDGLGGGDGLDAAHGGPLSPSA
jgi:hypothetical protein